MLALAALRRPEVLEAIDFARRWDTASVPPNERALLARALAAGYASVGRFPEAYREVERADRLQEDGQAMAADLQVLPTETTTLSANVQYLDTSYDSFVYFAPNQGLPPNTSCPFSPTTQTTPGGTINVFAIDCSGNQAFNSPKWSFNLDARQVVDLGPLDMHLNLGTRYRGSSYATADYLPYLQARPNFVSYGSITLADHDETMFLTLYVKNIENSRRLIGGTATSTGLIVANAEQPRTIGVRVGGSF